MCLFTNQNKPLKADKPIKVYKVVIRTDGKYHSFFEFVPRVYYTIGNCVKMTENLMGKNNKKFDNKLFNNPEKCISFIIPIQIEKEELYKVDRGLFTFNPDDDTWKHLPNAYIQKKENCDIFDIAVLECEIPVGAKYYKGFTYCYCKESAYVSDTLKIIREISF
jgi:hypothetical protein